ncbi:uncharacterized protein LOC110372842 isoform X1 [Helicoverpa armigera]|uniref:uncharacterized protein LOC110372842 isoform X1 n=1 Tax=Helicoverpa armigera TaxID=29058 RepID=UPI003082DFC5
MKNIKYILLLLCVFYKWGFIQGSSFSLEDDEEEYVEENVLSNVEGSDNAAADDTPASNCWMKLNAPHHFTVMDQIDDRYNTVRTDIHDAMMGSNFDEHMIEDLVQSRGAALREIHAFHSTSAIPSGINLGGFCMLRMPDSVLFFHRMKLRNNTHFKIESLHNDFTNMMVRINLCLHDLHLKGAYERSLTDDDPSVLIYAPTFGEVEFLLRNVKYKMEGQYRIIKNRLRIEMVNSEIIADDILMTYVNQAAGSSAVKIKKENLGNFMSRLKIDLDLWLKHYFNDYMIFISLDGISDIDKYSKYDKERATALEEYTDKAITDIVTRIRQLKADTIPVPAFTFNSIQGVVIKLYDGVIRGLDSMYRRSVATGVKQKDIRRVDTVVGFSNLKVVYKYEAMLPTGVPPLAGVLILSANELSAHLALTLVKDPETVDLDIEFLDQMKPESLTVEGAANTMIGNFKHLLEHQIVAMMSNTLLHGILMLRSLPSCQPFANQIGVKIKPNSGVISEYKDYANPQLSGETLFRDEFEVEMAVSSDEDEDYRAALRSTNRPQVKQNSTKSINKQSKKNIKRKNKPGQEKIKTIRNKKRSNKPTAKSQNVNKLNIIKVRK